MVCLLSGRIGECQRSASIGSTQKLDEVQILHLLEDDPRLSAHSVAEQLGVSKQAAANHLHALGKVYEVNQWVPQNLSDFDRKCRCEASTSLKHELLKLGENVDATVHCSQLDRLVAEVQQKRPKHGHP